MNPEDGHLRLKPAACVILNAASQINKKTQIEGKVWESVLTKIFRKKDR
jgi:hypothetical protein